MNAAPTQTQSTFDGSFTNSQQESFWLTKHSDGSVTEEKMERNLYFVPPTQALCRLRLLRFSTTFEIPKAAEYGGGMQTMLRLELRLVGGHGDGRNISPMVSATIGPKSKLGQIIRAALKRNLGPGEQFNLYSICHYNDKDNPTHDFVAMLQPSDKRDEQTGKPLHTQIVDKTITEVVEASADDDGWQN